MLGAGAGGAGSVTAPAAEQRRYATVAQWAAETGHTYFLELVQVGVCICVCVGVGIVQRWQQRALEAAEV